MMIDLPASILQVLAFFAPLFSRPVFKNALELLSAHFLCKGKRTVTNLIKCLGKHNDSKKFTKYFYVLRKAKWSTFKASKILFLLMVERLLPKDAQIEINIDAHLNRRRGPKIKGLGLHRDAVASSKTQKVLATGHNWLVATICDFPPLQKAKRGRPRIVGARLPNLEALLNDKKQKWVNMQIPWYSGATRNANVLTGTCLWYHNTVGGVPIRWILIKDPAGEKKPTALLVTDLTVCAEQGIAFFVGRWPIETTFQEINAHLGLETIHTWSDISVNRTAPSIIASYSLACLLVNETVKTTGIEITPQCTAWYEKKTVTFSDVMVYLKMLILNKKYFSQSEKLPMLEKIDLENLFYLVASG